MSPKSLTPYFLFIFLVLAPGSAHSQNGAPPPYAEQLIDRALKLELHKKRYWHLLLHYKPGFSGRMISEADGQAFFASPNGKSDPKAELVATLTRFFQAPETLKQGEEHPQCNFPARYKWLDRELNFDPRQLPRQNCTRLEHWRNQLSPNKATLVFASYFMNNPASMFGHTFLRLDGHNRDPRRKLLSYGVNYAANPDTTNAVLYALKGLAGFFQGTFSVFPYYTKVQEYSNWESRDLWEFELKLSQDQIDMMILHLWELGGTHFDYYYFDENCSYHILSLLEVANPELHLTDEFFFSVLPTDTVKAVTRQEGLVSNVLYRPAVLNQMRHKTEQMSGEEKDLLYDLVENSETLKQDPFRVQPVARKALIMDAHLDFLQYEAMHIEKENPDKPFRIPHSILLARSQLKFQRADETVTRFSERPDETHGSDRIHFGTGIFDDEFFQEWGYYPTLHDLMARDTGYSKDSQILFFDFNMRYYAEARKFRVDRFKLIDIVSLTPYEPLFTKPSWRLNLGVDTLRDFDCDFCNSFKGGGSFGYSYKPSFHSPFIVYSLLDAVAETSGHLEDNYRVGAGVVGGVLIDLGDDWRMQISGEYTRFPLGHESEIWKVSAQQRYTLSQNLDVRLEYHRIEKKDELLFGINLFF